MIEVCHGLERHAQPIPYRNPGGDCFACALAAALPFLYPDQERSSDEWFEWAFESFRNGKVHGSDELRIDNSFRGFKVALDTVSKDLGRLEIAYEMPEPHFRRATWRDEGHNGWAFQVADDRAARILEGYLRGGWVAFATISLDGGGPTVVKDDGSVWFNSIDHFVVLDGIRSVYEESFNDDGSFRSGSWNDYLHVVDSSARDLTGWHQVRTFMLCHGACAWWIARRDVR